MSNIGVHATHCCKWHGCKYGEDEICPVVLGKVEQEYPCEYCHDDIEDLEYHREALKRAEEIKAWWAVKRENISNG